jgi:hypothetical protein
MEEILKFVSVVFIFRLQIKANPLNPKVLEPPKLGIRVEKKPPTIPVPFKLTEVVRKVIKYMLQHFCVL